MTIAWLRDLEEKVQEAAERLVALREENEALGKKIEALEEKLAANAEGDPEAEAWSEERAEIRQRVEKLASDLETLLET